MFVFFHFHFDAGITECRRLHFYFAFDRCNENSIEKLSFFSHSNSSFEVEDSCIELFLALDSLFHFRCKCTAHTGLFGNFCNLLLIVLLRCNLCTFSKELIAFNSSLNQFRMTMAGKLYPCILFEYDDRIDSLRHFSGGKKNGAVKLY